MKLLTVRVFARAALVGTALFSGGCSSPFQHPTLMSAPYGTPSSTTPGFSASGMQGQCPALLANSRQTMCAPPKPSLLVHQPTASDKASGDAVWAQSRANFKSMCPDPASEQELAAMDRCLTEARAEAKKEQDAQAQRLPEERKRLAAVLSDPNHKVAKGRYRDKVEARRAAKEDVEVARNAGEDCSTTRTRGVTPPSCERFRVLQERAARADEAVDGALREVGKVLETHRIDPRDAEELGLL